MSSFSLHQSLAEDAQRAAPPLAEFVAAFSRLIDTRPDEARVVRDGGALLADLVARDDWLPDNFAQPDPERYQQFLLHRDPEARFSVVAVSLKTGQTTPIHDHTVWGLIGMLRGALRFRRYRAHHPVARVNRISVISDGTPKRFGGPQ